MASERTTSAPSIPSNRVKLVVASSVMLTFISFWRAAAVVLNDLGSSAFYAGGIAEEAVGKSAPWFILGVMLFSFAVRAVYVESCSMFTRGGVYRVVKEALGGTFAKLSVSALMFDYILTGPISGVSAGQYITGLLNELMTVAAAHNWLPGAMLSGHHAAPQLPMNLTVGRVCRHRDRVLLVAEPEGHRRVERQGAGSHEDHHRDGGDPAELGNLIRPFTWARKLPPWPTPSTLHFSNDALGFLKYTNLPATLGSVRHHHGLRPFRSGHERRGNAGAGQSRDRTSQAQEPETRRDRHRDLQLSVYRPRFPARGHADPRLGAGTDLP